MLKESSNSPIVGQVTDDDLLSTREAAELLGVGTSSVKRWADEGTLACVKTLGGHRRFVRRAVLSLLELAPAAANRGGVEPGASIATDDWIDCLVRATGVRPVRAKLEREYAERGTWCQVADAMGEVLGDLGRRWERGEINVLQEHLASGRLQRALAVLGETLDVATDAPCALLMTAPADDHTLGLALAELVLREAGWNTSWAGRRVPLDQAVGHINAGGIDLVAVSASIYSTDDQSLAAHAARLGDATRARGIPLVLGGSGHWPDPPPYGQRVRSFEVLHRLARAAVGRRVRPRPPSKPAR